MYSSSDSQQNLYPDDEEFTACTCQNLPAMLSVLLKAETMRRPAYKKRCRSSVVQETGLFFLAENTVNDTFCF